MSIEVCAVGGFGEVGRNMTAIKVDDEVVIIDMGIHLPNYIAVTENEMDDIESVTEHQLIKANAIPDYHLLDDWKDKVIGILPSHAHLDHIGAIPYIAGKFNAPIICSPYTAAVIKKILADNKQHPKNKIISTPLNSKYKLSKNITAEFISVTHSIPHTCFIALHTKYGVVLYALDFKFDNAPVVGTKPNYAAMEAIGKKGVILALVDSLYAHDHRKMPSESVVKEMLRDVLLGIRTYGKAIIVTTFASHIARLKTIVELGNHLNRKVVFLGRSLYKYVSAAEEVGIIDFSKVKIAKYSNQSKALLKKIEKEGPDKYLVVVTGHQGEPKSTLSKLVHKELPFKFMSDDVVIFSSNVIPVPINQNHRAKMEELLTKQGVRIFKDLHVSGHPAREDLREFIRLVNPKHMIPAHSEIDKMKQFEELAHLTGHKNIHFLYTGKKWKLPL